ncbi:SulP family inorganic anion transporter [Herbiconiux sp. VKM Ac-2851]|uniref:SulP family inorganic anion transporter n=1 Tax=Herbiconiux sp. VKM Ac-2851 TaxID=2739025 RepID=UPI0015654B1C|nr:SulP family inorganic anion transporter [Herbiconiux sp. VKM Ac-2851]NQX33656.1 SulP family inorganic anion transporter [Herbiconiux sp. VKM Ac-2851]
MSESVSTGPAPRGPAWFAPTLRGYRRAWLGRDLLAGLTAGAVIIPQAMAYATIANLPVQTGLYTCIVPMLVYALLGGSRAMSVSTTSTIATLTATTLIAAGVAADSDSDSADIPADLITLTLLVGVILLVARLLKLGSVVEVINRPTLIGIQIGVGATVAVGQLPKLLGEQGEPTGQGFIRSLVAVAEAIPLANPSTIVLGVASIAVLLVLKRVAPRVPGPLIVVAGGILVSAFGISGATGIDLIPAVAQGLPLPAPPSFENVPALLPGAFAIAVMAFLESTAVARGIREPGEPAIDSNRELLATSAANLVGSFFQTLPAAGGFSQSAVNKNAGARSQLATLTTVALAVLVGLFLGPVLSLLPQATLAALVFVAVLGLIDVRALARLRRVRAADFWIAIVVMVVGLTAGLLTAVAAGVVITLLMVLRALNQPRIRVEALDGDLVVTLLAPLYTANVVGTEQAILAAVAEHPGEQRVIVDMTRIEETSVTVLDAFTDLDRELAGTGHTLHLAGLPDAAARTAEGTGWYRALRDAGRVHPDAVTARGGRR